MSRTIVIGGGIVGTSVAYHLASRGAETVIFDRKDKGRATDAGAGILSDTWADFAVKAVRYYPELVERLESEQDGDTGYSRCGVLKVATSPDEVSAYEESKRIIFERQERRGYPPPDTLYEVSESRARELFPPLGRVEKALYYENGARVDGKMFTRAMRRAAEGRNLKIENKSVDNLVKEDGSVAGVIAEGEDYEASNVVIAGGAWSREFGDQLGVRIPVEPQRGQIVHLGLGETDTSGWPIVSGFGDHYMVPWPDSRVAVGATRETGSGFNPHTTVAGIREVLNETVRVAPGLEDAEIREMRVGLRPYKEDLLPVLGSVPGFENVYLATGHGPTGLQLGPYSGKLVADLILGEELETDISAFRLEK
ncbi:MAG: FAD-dependent oxidoreductase [Halobacteria archaeon]|nr:FAD-dependent oxidoreductase [Halobacteria archaeon]